jgi:hypothetical protein
MALPIWNEEGLLPAGVHPADLAELHERFVLDAPHPERRELLYSALAVHLKIIQSIIPAGVAWIDGSFCRCWHESPDDVDIVIKPTDWNALRAVPGAVKAKLYALLTLQDARATDPPVEISRLQPVGGAVDAFLCKPGEDDFWRWQWSVVLDATRNVVTGAEKGFAEVTW